MVTGAPGPAAADGIIGGAVMLVGTLEVSAEALAAFGDVAELWVCDLVPRVCVASGYKPKGHRADEILTSNVARPDLWERSLFPTDAP